VKPDPKDTKVPEAITSGSSQAEGIARFALRAKYQDLTPERRERLKVSVLDALACAINALGAKPIQACPAQVEEFGSPDDRCTLMAVGEMTCIAVLQGAHGSPGRFRPIARIVSTHRRRAVGSGQFAWLALSRAICARSTERNAPARARTSPRLESSASLRPSG
jgi:hypothetical protein